MKNRLLEPVSTIFWSGRRGSNSLPPPWQGGALPDELRPHIRKNKSDLVLLKGGASDRNRTNDTGIFSPLLYRLSYRGIGAISACAEMAATRIGLEPTTPSVTGWCSNQLSYRAMIAQVRAASYRGNVLYYIGKSVCCQAQICGKCNFLQKRVKVGCLGR